MQELSAIAPDFVAMAHRIVWCSVATVDPKERPRSRILHPFWEWDGSTLVGWIATGPTPLKKRHLEHSPFVSCNYWSPDHDTCVAECRAEWVPDQDTRTEVWHKFVNAPAPVGYDPSIVPQWDAPSSPAFGALRLVPWRLRVMPGRVMLSGGAEGETLTWEA